MSPEAQRIAIHEARNLGPVVRRTRKGNPDPNGVWLTYCTVSNGAGQEYESVPDYLNDLNACHEMEKAIKGEENWRTYINHLTDAAGFSYSESETKEENELSYNCCACHATASQRAEAFLRTIGKWQDSPQ